MLTSNYSRSSAMAGPVDGAIMTFNAQIGASLGGANSVTSAQVHHVAIPLPTGMKFAVTDVKSYQGVVATAAAAVNVGYTAGGTEIVNAGAIPVAAAAATTTFTVVGMSTNTPVEATGVLYVQLTAATNCTIAAPICVSVTGFVSAAPTSVGPRTVAGTGF